MIKMILPVFVKDLLKKVVLVLLLVSEIQLYAQKNPDKTESDFFEILLPTEGILKPKKCWTSDFVHFDFCYFSKKENCAIGIISQAWDLYQPATQLPQIETARLAASIAANEEDLVTTVLNWSKESVKNEFGADWGKEYYFKPKAQFDSFQHCKMLSLFKEGSGLILVFYFFDTPNFFLEDRFPMVRFF